MPIGRPIRWVSGWTGLRRLDWPVRYKRKKTTTKKREAKTSVTVGVRCHGPLLAMLDDYRRSEPDIPTRASALRRLAIIGLRDKTPTKRLGLSSRRLHRRPYSPGQLTRWPGFSFDSH
jgi:hypothetical protein